MFVQNIFSANNKNLNIISIMNILNKTIEGYKNQNKIALQNDQ